MSSPSSVSSLLSPLTPQAAAQAAAAWQAAGGPGAWIKTSLARGLAAQEKALAANSEDWKVNGKEGARGGVKERE